MKQIFKLFLSFFKIGLFTFGGGYAMISLVQNEFVDKQKVLTENEFMDMIAIAESTPGPVAINMATYVGYKSKGFLGSLFATIGVVLPSFIIIFAISLFLQDFLKYELVKKAFKGISCAVAVIIFFAGLKLFKNLKKTPLCLTIFAIAIIMMVLSEIKVIQFTFLTVSMIAIGGLIGILTLLNDNRKNKNAINNAENDNKGAE